jgi:hypothetical protein
MKARQTGIQVVCAWRDGDVTTVEVRLKEGSWPSEPIAPGTVWSDEKESVLDVHRLAALAGDDASFESYAIGAGTLQPGGPYSYYAWWTPDQIEAARDTLLRWERRRYEGQGHNHCRLTYQTIMPGDVAYVSKAGWISIEAYATVSIFHRGALPTRGSSIARRA